MESWNEIKVWRNARRAELITARTAIALGQRKVWNERMTALLEAGFGVPPEAVVGFCWPHKGEFDARFAVRRWRERGAVAALPEVIEKACPLQFRKWWPGAPMRPGVYGIPVPVDTEVLLPDVVIVPVNGFDEQGYRLGYGGGYFDRTLAALERRALSIGVAFEALRLPTIHPQPHDIPMDFIVTEERIYQAGGRPLTQLAATDSAVLAKTLLDLRGLPRRLYPPLAGAGALEVARGYGSPPCYAGELGAEHNV